MKKLLSIIALVLCTLTISAQQDERETASPLLNMEVVRKVSVMDVEGNLFENVVVTMKSSWDYFNMRGKVKVKIVDKHGRKVLKKTLKNVYLYVFPGGQVQVGNKNFDQIVIRKSKYSDSDFIGALREKEGVY